MATNINDYKNLKKVRKMYEDIGNAKRLLERQIEELKEFRKYVPVQECLSIMSNSRTILEIHINKCKRALEAKND